MFTRSHHWPLSWPIPVHTISYHPPSLKTHFNNISYPRTSSKRTLPSYFPTKTMYAFHSSAVSATSLTHLIILIISGEEFKSWSFSLFPVSIAFCHIHLGTNISLSTPFSNTLSLWSSLTWHSRSYTPIKKGNIFAMYNFNLYFVTLSIIIMCTRSLPYILC
jgi:hypothetical protein